MDDDFKKILSKVIIAILVIIALGAYFYIYKDDNEKSNQTLIIDRRIIQVRLLELKSPPPNTTVKLVDTKTDEIFDDVFVSKACPLYTQNELGKIMEVQKLTVLHVQENLQVTNFEGIYEYLCSDKKDKEAKEDKK